MRVYGAALVALVAAVGLLGARLAAAPPANGIRHAMAGAPGGGLYIADGRRGLLEVALDGSPAVVGPLPTGSPLALAASGRLLLLGDAGGAWTSVDGGRYWRSAGLPRTPYVALAISGDTFFAGGWTGGIWRSRDGGASWQRLIDLGETESLAAAGDRVLAATLLGGWLSRDGGATWGDLGLPPRMTAADAGGDGAIAGWDGAIYGTGSPHPDRVVPGGVWALAGDLAATASGIAGAPAGYALRGREVTALVSGRGGLYAGIAGGPVLGSRDGGATWRTLVEP